MLTVAPPACPSSFVPECGTWVLQRFHGFHRWNGTGSNGVLKPLQIGAIGAIGGSNPIFQVEGMTRHPPNTRYHPTSPDTDAVHSRPVMTGLIA